MFKIREKRFSFRVPCIKVPTDAVVLYEDSIVRVVRGSVSLYRFPGIRVFHVFNRAERFRHSMAVQEEEYFQDLVRYYHNKPS